MHRWIFGDESGNFDFSRRGSRWFLVGTMACDEETRHAVQRGLRALRERHATEGRDHDGVFHASEDRQAVRDEAFGELVRHPVRVDATLLDKPKAQPQLRTSEPVFYQYAWYYHLRYVLPQICRRGDVLHVVASDIGTKKKRSAFRQALDDVVAQCCPPGVRHEVRFWKNAVDECLQATDYFLWAVARRWEGGDSRSYELVSHHVSSEFDLFGNGTTLYY